MDTGISMAESLCCSPETTTTLLIGYILIQKAFGVNKIKTKKKKLHNSIYVSLCHQFSSVKLLSRDQLFATPLTASCQASLSITNSQSLPQTHVHWVGDAIQPSHPVVPFSSCLQCFPASGSFPMSQLFASGGHSIEVSASTSVLPMNTQDWHPLGWTG